MTFNNSILSGTVLARENIQSEGYVAGSTGWIIERDGDAEFNSIVVRGDIISIGALYTTRLIDGEIIIELNSNPTVNVTMNPEASVYAGDQSSIPIMLDYQDRADPLLGFRDTSNSKGVYYDSADGYMKVVDWLTGTRDGWNAVPGNNGYVGGEYKLLPDGNVLLDGNFNGGVAASPVVVGTLPVGYRPRQYMEFMVARGGAFGTNKLTVGTNGQITVWTPDATYNSYAAGIIFSTLA